MSILATHPGDATEPGSKVKADIALNVNPISDLTTTGRHLPCGITQCYLPPDTSERDPPNPTQAGTRLTYPGGMEG